MHSRWHCGSAETKAADSLVSMHGRLWKTCRPDARVLVKKTGEINDTVTKGSALSALPGEKSK